MNKKAQELKGAADKAKYMYNIGHGTYEEMREACTKYIDYCNEREKVIAKKYGMKPKRMSVHSYMR